MNLRTIDGLADVSLSFFFDHFFLSCLLVTENNDNGVKIYWTECKQTNGGKNKNCLLLFHWGKLRVWKSVFFFSSLQENSCIFSFSIFFALIWFSFYYFINKVFFFLLLLFLFLFAALSLWIKFFAPETT